MKPYYTNGKQSLYFGDCRDILPELKCKADLILTDPPFFMPATHYQSRVKWLRSWGDTSILAEFWRSMIDKMIDRMRPTGHLLTFCNAESYPVFYPEMYRRFNALAARVWDKQHFGFGRVWRHQFELIIAARWDTSVFYEDGKGRSDIIRAKVTTSKDRSHPVEKPHDLLCELIEVTTEKDNLIIDPFMGGGGTLIAARYLERRCIGIESEERYCEVAAKRLEQTTLFDFLGEQNDQTIPNRLA